MPWAADHKENSRIRLLDVLGKAFRRSGPSGTGVDGLAREAGMTSGAFYGHFKSKKEAFADVVELGVDKFRQGVAHFISQSPGRSIWIENLAAFYLGKGHRAAIESGCALPSLSVDVARADTRTRRIYANGLRRTVDEMVAAGLDRDKAWSLTSELVGAVVLARAAGSELGDEIAESVLRRLKA